MRLLLLLFIGLFPFFNGKPAKDAKIILEDIAGKKQFEMHTVGKKGKASFNHLVGGSYRLAIEFPQQEGRWKKQKPRHSTLTKATFSEKTRTYYYQGSEGFFSVKLNKFRRIDRDSFRAVFKEGRNEASQKIIIAEFIAKKNRAQFSMQIKKLTAKQFKKATAKVGNDISIISIQNIK
jgi:hypothetical protein